MNNRTVRPAKSVSKVSSPNPQFTTVWSFPERGAWATHNNKYRGNFAPQVARNIIQMYSEPGQTVLDPMAGGGTTLSECRLLSRRFIGCDINPDAIAICEKATAFDPSDAPKRPKSKSDGSLLVCADVRDLSFIGRDSVDLILTPPPISTSSAIPTANSPPTCPTSQASPNSATPWKRPPASSSASSSPAAIARF
jgi:hypothetical protein